MIMLVILVMGALTWLVSSLNKPGMPLQRDNVTSAALAQAKDALIGYATSVTLTPSGSKRPGDLPCPDINNDGSADPPCSGNALGRLPWKTLGLPDLRDGSGERLWYAVSSNFKNNPRSATLNSDTPGTLSLFSSSGNILYNGGASGTGLAAVIIAPGEVLTRRDMATAQDRSSANINNPINFLDIATVAGLTEDNANFLDGSSSNGFIQGRIKGSDGAIILNDQLLAITQDNIMQAIQKRVAAEIRQCLNAYASDANNRGHYPWAARLDPTQPPNYNDTSNRLFGRVPDNPFDNTRNDGDNKMLDTWTGNCNINSASGWWLNWKEIVFYGLADAYKPADPLLVPAANACAATGACLAVNPPSALADKQFVVIVAGKTLPGQARASNANKGTLSNYLEGVNANGASPYTQIAPSATFNDTLVFQ